MDRKRKKKEKEIEGRVIRNRIYMASSPTIEMECKRGLCKEEEIVDLNKGHEGHMTLTFCHMDRLTGHVRQGGGVHSLIAGDTKYTSYTAEMT